MLLAFKYSSKAHQFHTRSLHHTSQMNLFLGIGQHEKRIVICNYIESWSAFIQSNRWIPQRLVYHHQSLSIGIGLLAIGIELIKCVAAVTIAVPCRGDESNRSNRMSKQG